MSIFNKILALFVFSIISISSVYSLRVAFDVQEVASEFNKEIQRAIIIENKYFIADFDKFFNQVTPNVRTRGVVSAINRWICSVTSDDIKILECHKINIVARENL